MTLNRRGCAGLVALGVMAMSATGVLADQPAGLAFSCTGSAGVDAARVAEICADFLQAVRSLPDLSKAEMQAAPLASGPGLEIVVAKVTATKLEVIPTSVDAAGRRSVQPPTGILTMDTSLTSARRLAFFRKLLADFSR